MQTMKGQLELCRADDCPNPECPGKKGGEEPAATEYKQAYGVVFKTEHYREICCAWQNCVREQIATEQKQGRSCEWTVRLRNKTSKRNLMIAKKTAQELAECEERVAASVAELDLGAAKRRLQFRAHWLAVCDDSDCVGGCVMPPPPPQGSRLMPKDYPEAVAKVRGPINNDPAGSLRGFGCCAMSNTNKSSRSARLVKVL